MTEVPALMLGKCRAFNHASSMELGIRRDACEILCSSTFDETVLGVDSQTKDSYNTRQHRMWSVCVKLRNPCYFHSDLTRLCSYFN